MQKFQLTIFLVFVFFSLGNAQVKWTVKKPFEQKNFIENKGQFFIEDKLNSKEILYAASIDGLTYYFTKTGYIMQHLASQKNTEKEIEELKEKAGIKENAEGEEEKEFKYKTISQLHQMQWQGTSVNVQIVAEDIVSNYYTYSDLNDKQGKKTIKAQAYKKLTYKNIYPFIDVVYEFPADTTGIKYSIYLHPGANVNNIKINYPDNNGINLNQQGNILIKSEFGLLTDHKPITYQQNNKAAIKSNFILHNNTVGFYIDKPLTNETIVIDPWTANPNFPLANNNAYDVDWDNAGNCYVYGGPKSSYQVIKFNSSGVPLWSFIPSITFTFYGDFVVDKKSQSVYILEGYASTGARVVKINAAGALINTFAGNPGMVEGFRIALNSCENTIVLAGGGDTSPYYTACVIDTNFTSLAGVNMLNLMLPWHDLWGLALDNAANAYMVSARSLTGTADYDNVLFKVPIPALTPNSFTVSTNYHFREASSLLYNPSTYPNDYENGFNGMLVSNNNLYTYDSYVLKKWNTSSGAMMGSLAINGTSLSTMTYGGIAANNCDKIFVGLNNQINQYDAVSTFSLQNTYNASGTIYDLSLDNNNMLYACGANFVSAISVNLNSCSTVSNNMLTTQSVQNAGCGNSATGSATVTPTSGTAPYTITWNTTPPQTGNTAHHLLPGTYLATITDASCSPLSKVDTVVIGFTGFQSQINQINIICNGLSTGVAAVTPIAGTFPFTYQWQTGQNTSIVSGLAAGTYTVKVSDATSCYITYTFSITQPPAIVISFSSSNTKCDGDTTSIKVNATGGISPYTYLWNTNATTNQIHGAMVNVVYTVTIKDSAQCTKAATYTLTQPVPITAIISKPDCKTENSSYLKVIASGGATPYTYSWSTNPVQTTDSIYNLSPGNYSVTVIDANLCAETFSESIYLNFQTLETVNVFTPNGDTKNEVFFPFAYGNGSINVIAVSIDNYELYIYDRWGKKVFYTTQPTNTWDGKEANGNICDEGVYYWMLSINSKCQNAGTQTFKGFVHLDR